MSKNKNTQDIHVTTEVTPSNPNAVKTQYNAHLFPKYHETITGPSQTVPDQALSLQELLLRHTRGLSLGATQHPVYMGDEDYFPDLRKLDLSEIHELKKRNAEEIDDYENFIDAEQKEKLKAASDAKFEAEIQKRLAEEQEKAQKSEPKK